MYFSLSKRLLFFLTFLALSRASPIPAAEPDWSAPLTYEAALKLAIERDLLLKLGHTETEAADGQVEQAGLRPNPIVEAEFENFLGTGPISGVDGLVFTLGVNRLIETAKKREKRTAVARSERELADWNRELRLAGIESEVRRAFVAVLLAQEKLSLRREQLELAEHSEAETARLVEAARSPQVEQTRARLAVRQQLFILRHAEHELEAANGRLAALWGFVPPPSFSVLGSVRIEEALPDLPSLMAILPETASLAQYEAITRSRLAALELEEARAKPDYKVFTGGRYLNDEGGDVGFVAGVSIPWPRYDRNQGNIRAARARLDAVEFEKEATRRELMSALASAYRNLVAAAEEANAVRGDLLPAAKQTLAETEAGYERGQFNQLAVLESRKALFEIRETYLEALALYALARAQIEALTRPAAINR